MNRQQAIELVKNSLIDAIRATGNRGFQLSQVKCPVVSGYLKSKGYSKDIEQGFELGYQCEYASFPERGTEPGIRNVRTYRRKDGVVVKAHQYFSKGMRAQHYIEEPLKKAFESDFKNNFDSKIRSSGVKVTKVG